MKHIISITLILVTMALLLCGCMERGNVNHVHRTVGESAVYTKAEIEDAMDVVIRHFRQNFEGCTLIHLAYYEENNDPAKDHWAKQYDADQYMILISSFEVGPNGPDGSLNPNSTYNGWQWILTRDIGGPWTLRTSGVC